MWGGGQVWLMRNHAPMHRADRCQGARARAHGGSCGRTGGWRRPVGVACSENVRVPVTCVRAPWLPRLTNRCDVVAAPSRPETGSSCWSKPATHARHPRCECRSALTTSESVRAGCDSGSDACSGRVLRYSIAVVQRVVWVSARFCYRASPSALPTSTFDTLGGSWVYGSGLNTTTWM